MSKILPQRIGSTQGNMNSLNEELQDVHSKIQNTEGDVESIHTKVEQLRLDVNNISFSSGGPDATEFIKEVKVARDGHISLDARLDELETRQIDTTLMKQSYSKAIEYNEHGNPSIITYNGDITKIIRYSYHSENPDVLIREDHYNNKTLEGSIVYTYEIKDTEWVLKGINSVNTDVFQVVSDNIAVQSILDRLALYDDLNIDSRLTTIESNTGVGQFDGEKLTKLVNTYEARIQSLEGVAFKTVDSMINLPEILERIDTLELLFNDGRHTDTFVIEDSITEYRLTTPVIKSINIQVDGYDLTEGINNDFVLKSDKRTVSIFVKLLEGSTMKCEYY